ncbi:MAG: ABC transporter permease [Planctomycetota bacterium]
MPQIPETPTLPVAVNSPEAAIRHPRKLLAEVFRDLYEFRGLVWVIFRRDLKAQFRQSYLGYVWLFLPPLLTTAIWFFLSRQNVITVPDTGTPYPLFVLTGSVFWQTLVRLLQNPLASFRSGRSVFTKLKVPPEAFIAAGTLRAIFEMFIYLIVLAPALFYFQVNPGATILLLPIVLVALTVFGTAIGLLLVPVGSLYSDIEQGIPLVMGFLMYMAPVVYPPPENGLAGEVIRWNPATPLLMAGRDALTTGETDYLFSAMLLVPVSLLVILVCLFGLRAAMPHVVARIGN